MKLNPLSAALLGAGVTVIGTAGAFDLTPHWLKKSDRPPSSPQAAPQAAPAERVVPPAPLSTPVGQVPNYRAIVKQSAPAVVGVTVEGTHKASFEEQRPAARHGGRSVLQVLQGRARPRPARPARTRRRRSRAWARASSSAPTA